jgi:hypothetical protein
MMPDARCAALAEIGHEGPWSFIGGAGPGFARAEERAFAPDELLFDIGRSDVLAWFLGEPARAGTEGTATMFGRDGSTRSRNSAAAVVAPPSRCPSR